MTHRFVGNNLPMGRGTGLRHVRSVTLETQFDLAAKLEDNANIIGLSGDIYKSNDDRPWGTPQSPSSDGAPAPRDVVLLIPAVADFAEVQNVAMNAYDFSAHFASADTITYSVNKTLPSGVSIANDTGIMSGTPDTVETVTGIQVIATTVGGQAATDKFDYVVAAP